MSYTAEEIGAAMRQSPDTITLLVCGSCGRTDRFVGMKRTGHHFSAGKKCLGPVVPVKYRKARS